MWLNKLYHNHVFATLAYLLVVVLGLLAYPQLPRERAPEEQSHVVNITVTLPGVSAKACLLAEVQHCAMGKMDLAIHHRPKSLVMPLLT